MHWFNAFDDIEWQALLLSGGMKIGGALLVLILGLFVIKWIAGLTERSLKRVKVDPTAAMFLRKVAYVILWVLLALTVLNVVGVPMTSAFALLGAAGLAIGLALKDSLSNIASGVMLVTLRPFKVGDVVTIHSQTGTVESVSIFETCLRGPDNQTIVLPNSLITSDSIINLTPDFRRRIELVIRIGHDDDIDLARATALEVIHADDRVLPEPAPDVLVYELAEAGVNLGIRCHARNADYFATKCALTEGIKKAFDKAGITIPIPRRDVRVLQQS